MIEKIKIKFSKRTMLLITLLSIALLSIFVVSKIVTAPSFNSANIKSLDDKKVIVMKLAAAAAASSTALSLIPGDAAMPIANQIAELSSYFIVVLCAILLEKMLIAVVGYVSFTFIIPFACILGVFCLYINKIVLKTFAIKLTIFGVILFMAIPASIYVSDLMYSSYQASIEQTVETAKQNKEYIEKKKNEFSKEDKNWIKKAGDYLSNFTSKIGNGISEITKKGEDTLGTFLDTIAVLIITSCVIPIVVILIFAWVIKILFGFDIKGITRHDDEHIPTWGSANISDKTHGKELNG
ncbi:hypothetical protein KPL47_08900 [Clostridium estertheticum]|uniref:hypothetical protein n=1 Tax=Clostridium estertheticum TaxID=238834 RepID=UPI001C0D667B|nr:hypothetical protein [Clostridium estertheticum]MBU3176490.1 hypothetical protein [Clostridium estertheticum]